ncbi:MAG TPA: PAS domain S-box protein, partial [Candidatus Acidoferrum sp.]|nr:PAS domain S-box protein [Candidatus Acidoferrum sp.]
MVQRQGKGGVRPGGRGRSLRTYMALFMVVLLAVAAVAALSVRLMFESDARAAALADSNFAASRAAAQLKSGFDQINALSIPLSKDPSVLPLFANPANCSLGYAPLGAFTTGRIDLVRLDGSVACSSSQAAAAGGAEPYNNQAWLSATSPLVVAPVLDPVTGGQVVVITYPIPGKGALVWFLDLVPIGPFLASEFGSGTHALEFLITSANDQVVIARSIDSAQSVGRKLSGAPVGTSSSPDLNGVTRIYGQPITNAAGWRLHVGADEDAALSVADLSANRFLIIIVIGVGAMTLVVLVVYRRVAEPVRRLSLVMRRAKPGELASAAVGAGAREVTDLAEDFDKLMARIDRELADRLAGEEKALASERNYRSLFESHPQPMWLYDVHTLFFLRVNDAAIERYGYSRDEFLAMTINDIRPPAVGPKVLEPAELSSAFD